VNRVKEKLRYPYDRRSGIDRRSGTDRRKKKRDEEGPHTGVDRRSGREQRLWSERRKEWAKKEDWSSVWSELNEAKEEPEE
jgi:hypothetical protein